VCRDRSCKAVLQFAPAADTPDGDPAWTLDRSNCEFVHTCPPPKMKDRCTVKEVMARLGATTATYNSVEAVRNFMLSHGVEVKASTARRAFLRCHELQYGDLSSSFAALFAWKACVELDLGGNHFIDIKCTPEGVFSHCAMAFAYAPVLYENAVPVWTIDACHHKHFLGGVWHAVIAKLANGATLPLAVSFSAVPRESEESWRYLLGHLVRAVGYDAAVDRIAVMSDRDLGMAAALNSILRCSGEPSSSAGPDFWACSKHVARNAAHAVRDMPTRLKRRVEGVVHRLATAASRAEFDSIMMDECEKCEIEDVANLKLIFEYLQDEAQMQEDWAFVASATTRFSLPRFGVVTSNDAESFMKYLLPARDMPAPTALAWVWTNVHLRYIQMKRIADATKAAFLADFMRFPSSLSSSALDTYL